MAKDVVTVKMSYADFVTKGISSLRDETKSKGINPRFSGLNDAMKKYYGESLEKETEQVKIGEETRTMTGASAVVQRLVKAGKIDFRPTKGGVQIFLKGDLKASSRTGNGQAVLAKMGIK